MINLHEKNVAGTGWDAHPTEPPGPAVDMFCIVFRIHCVGQSEDSFRNTAYIITGKFACCGKQFALYNLLRLS